MEDPKEDTPYEIRLQAYADIKFGLDFRQNIYLTNFNEDWIKSVGQGNLIEI